MASDVGAAVAASLPGGTQGFPVTQEAPQLIEDTPEEIRDFQKIINLRNLIYTGMHPRFKPPSILRPAATTAEAPPASLASMAEKNKGVMQSWGKQTAAGALGAAGVNAATTTATTTSTGVATITAAPSPATTAAAPPKSQIDDVLLTKSEVLIRAEQALKRQRIEQEVKQQLSQKKAIHRTDVEVRDGHAFVADDVDIEDAMSKAGIPIKPLDRLEDPASLQRLHNFFGDKDEGNKLPELDTRMDTREEVSQPAQPEGSSSTLAEIMNTTTAVRPAESPRAPVLFRPAESPRERERLHRPSSSRRESVLPSPQAQAPPLPIPERMHSPQPRYSATNQVRSPAAPQPVRPANMARVESQDHIREFEQGAAVRAFAEPVERVERHSPPQAHQPIQYPARRVRSPEPYIKQEPRASPRLASPLRDSYARRPPSPVARPGSVYGRPPYEHSAAAPDYHYAEPQHPPPPHHRPQYDPYSYYPPPPAYGYPPPPVDPHRPAYPLTYATPPPAGAYYPPARPPYDEYPPHATRYASRPPPEASPPRRLASPGAFPPFRARRSTRSISPNRRGRASVRPHSPKPERQASPARPPRPPTALARGEDGRALAEPRADPMMADYARRGYYDRDPYYPPPPPGRYDGMAPPPLMLREGDWRGYRDREYSSYPPVPPPRAAYPMDYNRDPRAPSVPPLEHEAYLPPPRDPRDPRNPRDYYPRPDPRDPRDPRDMDGRDGRMSVRPEARPQSVRLVDGRMSVRPEVPEFYGGGRDYRAGSVRPDVERERYGLSAQSYGTLGTQIMPGGYDTRASGSQVQNPVNPGHAGQAAQAPYDSRASQATVPHAHQPSHSGQASQPQMPPLPVGYYGRPPFEEYRR
jgi:hypothetical protein